MNYIQSIQINNFTYLIKLDKNISLNKYKCLINYNLLNNNFIKIKDIYFIDSSITNTDELVFPVNNSKNSFSTDYYDYDNDIIDINNSFIDLNEYIYTDRLKIYNPFNKKNLNYIIYAYSLINNVNLYFICKQSKYLDINAETEFTINNIVYSEYQYVDIPNILFLLNKNNNITFDILGQTINLYDIFEPSIVYKNQNDEYVLTKQSELYESNTNLYERLDTNNLYIYTTPLNIMIYPYSGIDSNNKYIIDSNYSPNVETFKTDLNLKLNLSIGYNNDCNLSLIGKFSYNEDIIDESTVQSLYENMNNVNRLMYLSGVLDDYIEDDGSKLNPIKYYVAIASDRDFNQIIYNDCLCPTANNIEDTGILNNFIILIDKIFSDWNEIPDLVNAKVVFLDLIVGIQISSNPIKFTKEQLKFYYNNINKDTKFIDMQIISGKLNLIDKASCTILMQSNTSNNVNNYYNSPKVIIKPVFYRTYELSQITIKNGITLNIGINLSDYLSKVESFVLTIDDNNFTEYARNDAYVIFKIIGSKITSTSGEYNIFTGDGDYLTSGKYTVS